MSDACHRLGRYTFTPGGRLMHAGHPVPLGSKSSEILRVLLEADGHIVSKEELIRAVWPHVAVEENALQVHISALRRALGDAAVRLITVRGVGYRIEQGDSLDDATPLSLAILPFVNLTTEPLLDDLAEGLTEELIGTLSRETGLAISGRTASSRFTDREQDVRAIGRNLGVASVLEGSIRASGGQARITVELIDTATGFQAWAACYDIPLGDNLALETMLATTIRQELKEQLAGREGTLKGALPPLAG